MAAAPSAIKERIEELRAALHRHNHNYYILNAPEISDQEFDALMKELETLEHEYPDLADPLSPTQRVGSDMQEGFVHVVHELSLIHISEPTRRSV